MGWVTAMEFRDRRMYEKADKGVAGKRIEQHVQCRNWFNDTYELRCGNTFEVDMQDDLGYS